jgi:hypothetical protein
MSEVYPYCHSKLMPDFSPGEAKIMSNISCDSFNMDFRFLTVEQAALYAPVVLYWLSKVHGYRLPGRIVFFQFKPL